MGIAAPERFSREVVKSTALAEIALAVFAAIIIHSLCILLLTALGLNPLGVVRPIIVFETEKKTILVWPLIQAALPYIAIYIIGTASAGFAVGYLIARLVQHGPLRFLATHSWIYDVMKHSGGKSNLVTAYVMTKTVENEQALMYKGRLAEIFLNEDGTISYLALKNCQRFYMKLNDLTTSDKQLTLFDTNRGSHKFSSWNYLMVGGGEIANVLFNRSDEINETEAGIAALEKALETQASPDEDDADSVANRSTTE